LKNKWFIRMYSNIQCNASQKCRGRFSSDLRALLITDFIRRVSFVNNGWRELKETPSSNRKIPCQAIMFCLKSCNSKQQIHRKHCLLKNKNDKHVNGGSSKCTVILSVMCHRNVRGRSSSDLRALLIADFIPLISFVNNGRRELKETRSSNWKIPCQAIIDHRGIENCLSANHNRCERKETTRANFGRNAKQRTTMLVKSCNSKQQIHRKHWLLKNKDDKHVNGGSSECTVILSVMYHRNVSGRFSYDLRALLIAGAFPLVSVVFRAITFLIFF
ncbi:hypothetical protein T01_2220, partial [Trichinella spiralis]